jgi:hypothetical protein
MKATAFSLSILLAPSSLAFGTAKAVLTHRRAGDPPAELAPPAAVAVVASAAPMRQLATGS